MKKIRTKQKAFTVVEIVTVVTIIAILTGILLPAISAVNKSVMATKQKAQLNTIELAIQAFKNDTGDYPPSDWRYMNNNARDYSGAHMLTEALLGWDLMGFHPKSIWRSDGEDGNGNDIYKTDGSYPEDEKIQNLRERNGVYIEQGTENAFLTDELFGERLYNLERNSYLLCDEYRFKKVTLKNGKRIIAGAPILYYKAKPFKKTIDRSVNPEDRIYDFMDNMTLVQAKEYQDDVDNDIKDVIVKYPGNDLHPLIDPSNNYEFFYEKYIVDTRASDPTNNNYWPYNPESYLLISAGYDGLYGTEDDITNFK
jgi:type II secretory pathway pseudopilin PulG